MLAKWLIKTKKNYIFFKKLLLIKRLSNISVTFRTNNSVIYENFKLTILRCYNLTNILILVIIRKIIQKI